MFPINFLGRVIGQSDRPGARAVSRGFHSLRRFPIESCAECDPGSV